jgi:agmatine deiminase
MAVVFPHFLPTQYRVPAEWEPQQVVSIATPPGEEFDPSQLVGRLNTTVESVHGAMVNGLLGHTKVRLLARTEQEGRDYAKTIGADGLSNDAFEIVPIAHGDIWVRDTGPIWARNEHGDLGIVWMGFDNWGYFPRITGDWATCDIPNYLPRDLCSALGIPVFRTPLIAEGGDKSFNGKGS